MIPVLTLCYPKKVLSILRWRLRASTGMKHEFLRSFPGPVFLLALLYKRLLTTQLLCPPAVSLSHQRRRRRQPPLPPLSRRERMNGRTLGAGPSRPKRNSVSLCPSAVRAGAEKPLLLQRPLLALRGERRQRAWRALSLVSVSGSAAWLFLVSRRCGDVRESSSRLAAR